VNNDDLALPSFSSQGFFFLNTLFTCSVPGNEEAGFCDDPVTNQSLGNSNPGELLPFSPATLLSVYTGTGTLPFSITPELSYATSTNIGTTTVTPDVSGQDINNAQDVFLIYTFTDPPSVPEPGSLVLLGCGLVMLGSVRYRKAFQTKTMAPARNPRSA
jgi:PEP-CTERM motif